MIYTVNTQSEVDAIPNPKHVWFNLNHFVVTTGSDMPSNSQERIIPVWKFRDRFTTAEIDVILNLVYSGDSVARLLILKLQTASDGIELDSSDVQQGTAYLVNKSVLTQARANAILS
jgi:hypothetical protein